MSHGRERKEKDCLNCGTMVEGRYCQVCGQENTEPHETFLGMVNHFFSDITHFDGKFFKTLGILGSKPGFLSKQYISGKRNSYLHPVRMYVFTSAVFFLVVFTFYSVKNTDIDFGSNTSRMTDRDLDKWSKEAYRNADSKEDSAQVREALEMLKLNSDTVSTRPKRRVGVIISSDEFETVAQYDSIQASMPAGKRDNFLKRMLIRKGLDMNERYPGEEGKLMAEIINKFMHTLPSLLFVSLPLYGFFLYLLYLRRKRFYFADHAIFLVHQYIFTFILLMLFILFQRVPYGWINFITGAIFVYGIVYTLKAFKNFYGQGWFKTIMKFLLFNFLCLVSLTFLFAIFFGYALFQV
ncbi:MAG: DUF3667 domain-containing protein [Chitinophagaceae bacterium]